MKSKHGKISLVVTMLVIAVTALLILGIFGEPIKKAFAAVTDPLLKKIGLEEDDSEQQIVEQELLENAKQVFNNFKAVLEHCKNSQDLKCACGKMDFTKLNKYSILLSSNNADTKNSFLKLLGSDGLPVVEDPTPIYNNFPTVPKSIYEDSGKFNNYNTNNNQLIFSIEKVIYKIYKPTGESVEEKFKDHMGSIYFSKPQQFATIFDKYDNKVPMYICRSFSCCGEVPVSSEFTSTCTYICSTDGCISGVNDGSTSKNCNENIGFEEDHPPDDYCICGTGSENAVPLPYKNEPSCTDLCAAKGKVCIIGIDNGKGNKKCSDNGIRFEGDDDFCVCGDTSQKVIPNPSSSNLDSTCKVKCGGAKCIMGIDDSNTDGGTFKKCDKEFRFEKNDGDDYCFCGGDSEEVIPNPTSANIDGTSCDTICHDYVNKGCIIGVDDSESSNTKKKCNEPFRFEKNDGDDYCVCGDISTSEKAVPLPYPGDDPTCTQICGPMPCRNGVDDGGNKLCSQDVTFETNNDYCVCGGDSKIIYGIPG